MKLVLSIYDITQDFHPTLLVHKPVYSGKIGQYIMAADVLATEGARTLGSHGIGTVG